MLKSSTCLFTSLLLTFFANIIFANPSQVINLSSAIINDTSKTWNDAFFAIFNDSTAFLYQTNIDKAHTPANGRYVVSLPLSATTTVSLNFYQWSTHSYIKLCTITMTAVSAYHASMVQTYQNNNSTYLCHFSGNPDDNTAKILLTDNKKGA